MEFKYDCATLGVERTAALVSFTPAALGRVMALWVEIDRLRSRLRHP